MRPRSPHTPNARAVARALVAAVLAFVVAAGAVPFGPALGAHGCSMSCCTGADGTPGDCEGGSCPISHAGTPKAETPEPTAAVHAHHTGEETQPHEGIEDAHHAESGHDSTHAPEAVRTEHSHHADVSPRNTSTASPVVSAVLSKPCPPECGGVPTSSTQLRRAREEAALSDKHQPRPLVGVVLARAVSGVTKNSSALRRQYPPRAPPHVPASRPV